MCLPRRSALRNPARALKMRSSAPESCPHDDLMILLRMDLWHWAFAFLSVPARLRERRHRRAVLLVLRLAQRPSHVWKLDG